MPNKGILGIEFFVAVLEGELDYGVVTIQAARCLFDTKFNVLNSIFRHISSAKRWA